MSGLDFSTGQSLVAFNLEDLPNELWLQVLTYLPFSDRLQLRLVCKRWNSLASLPEFMTRTRIRIERSNLNAMIRYVFKGKGNLTFENVELRNLRQSRGLEKLLAVIGPQVRHLKVKHSPVFASMDGRLPNLHILAINSTTNFDTPLNKPVEVLNLCQFSSLIGFECDGVNLDCGVKLQLLEQLTRQVSCIKLERLQFEYRRDNEPVLLEVLSDHAKTMKFLDLFFSSAPLLPLKDWSGIFTKMEKLATLKLSGNCPIEVLSTILSSVPSVAPVRHIDLTGMLTLSGELLQTIAVKWSSTLELLELMFCVQLDDSCVTALKKLRPKLRGLSVAYCRELSSTCLLNGLAFEMNSTLQELHLEEIFNLDEASICILAARLPNLKKLSMDNCRNAVTDTALAAIFQHQTSLQELYFDYCIRITDEGLLGFGTQPYPMKRLRGLRVLSMRGCRNLSNRTLMLAMHFPELRHLMLGYCHKFSSIGFEALVMHCPALDNLCLASCFMVDDLTVAHIVRDLKRLRKLNLSNCVNITERSIDLIAAHCDNLEELIVCGVDTLNFKEVQEHLHEFRPRLKDVIM